MLSDQPDIGRYAIWALIVAAGAAIAFFERRATGRYRAWILLILLAAGGWVTMGVSPFTFSGGDHYMQGLILFVGALMLLGGYAGAIVLSFIGHLASGESK